jgi:hypothetical protein
MALRAAFVAGNNKIPKFFWLKYCELLNFESNVGRRNTVGGPHAARGPRV